MMRDNTRYLYFFMDRGVGMPGSWSNIFLTRDGMRSLVTFCLVFISLTTLAQSKGKLEVSSPDKKNTVRVRLADKIFYSVSYDGVSIIEDSPIGMTLSDRVLGSSPVMRKSSSSRQRGVIQLPYGQATQLSDEYNELRIDFEGNYSLILRAYNEGVAYRFETAIPGPITVVSEEATFNIKPSMAVNFPESDVFTSWEVPYVSYNSINDIGDNTKAITPVLFTNDRLSVVVAESDVLDYPGMYLGKSIGTMKGVWAKYPKKTQLGSWGNFVSVVKETEDFIAKTDGSRSFPWRVIISTKDDKSLLTNELIFKLAKPLAIDASWIKPGKATWEWWHDAIVEDAGIPSGMKNRNTDLYKHYIDFAAANNIEFLMLDAGWSDIFDLAKIQTKNDIHELIRYGKSKGVDLFLWCVATTLMNDLDRYMELMSSWGVAGLKVDFIDRDDQEAITWFEKIASAAAKRKLMINFHGCSKPTGLERAYPNIVNYEAVRGAECSKWDHTANPDHHVTVLFSRMLAGPLDYTPGSMRNKTKETFKPIDPGLPSTQGTRCHELSMYVLFDQPFAMLCDAPAEYRKYPDIMKYLSAVPTAFDETKVLDAKTNQYAIMAKRKNNEWFVGAMTNWTGRKVTIDFSFLPKGKKFTADIYSDGKDANTNASQYEHKSITVDNSTKLNLDLANGGGAAIYIHP